MLPFKWPPRAHWNLAQLAGGLSVLTLAVSTTGWLQPLEWFALDQFFQLRASSGSDPRVLIVTIDEPDINYVGEWPIPDAVLADLLLTLSQHEPSGIGLDMYRNLPVGEGQAKLTDAFNITDNLVGVEKVVGQPIDFPSGISNDRQVGMADIVVDDDGRVRRALLAIENDDGSFRYGLATQLVLNYLEQENIYPDVIDEEHLRLGKATLRRFHKDDGGYANADDGGSQILINYPGGSSWFKTVSMSAVLEGQVPTEQIKDRIVLVGSIATSLNDFFYTPVNRTEEMSGVFVHAHIASQLLGAALDGRTLLHGVPFWGEGIWILLVTTSASLLFHVFTQSIKPHKAHISLIVIKVSICFSLGVILLSYALLTLGIWVPIAAPLLSSSMFAGILVLQQNQKLRRLAAFDQLTQIPNRRSFDQFLQANIATQEPFTLVMCDVDYFKRYNDTYGHQAGDTCLVEIARVLNQSVRKSDLAARYGGEEFSLVLNSASIETTQMILERAQQQLSELKLKHEASDIDPYVTLSFGALIVHDAKHLTPKEVIEHADEALYQAKQQGRNQFFIHQQT